MAALDKLLEQRSRVAFWTPLLCVIILAGIFYSPFGSTEVNQEVEFQISETEFEETKMTGIGYFYSGHVEFTQTDSSSSEVPFQSESQIVQWEALDDDDFDDLADIGENIEEKSTSLMYLLFLLAILLIVRIQGEWEGNKFINGKSVTGGLLAMVFLISISGTFTIYSEFEDSLEWFEEDFGEMFGEEIEDEWNDGFFGGVEISEDGMDLEISYGPSLTFWLFLILSIVALAGSAANLSYLKDDLEIEDRPTWFSSETPPDFVTKNMPKLGNLLLTIAVITVLTSLIMPWYSVDQTWEVQRSEIDPETGEETWANSTHEIGWEMTPYVLSYTNYSDLETGNGSESSSFDSYSEHNELENISPVILQLRWPLTCATILGLFFLVWNNNKRLSEKLEGKENLWTLFMMLGIVAMLSLGTGSFHEDMTKYAEDDLVDLTPNRNISISNTMALDSFFGKSVSFYGGGWFFETDNTYFVLQEWGGGIGYFAAGLSQWLIVAGLLSNAGPRMINKLNQEENPFAFEFDQEEWKSRPAIAALISILLLSTLGSGMGELVVDSEKAAPPGEYLWFTDYFQTSDESSLSKNFESNEEWVFEIDSSYNETNHVVRISFYFYCDEESQALVGDQDDTIDWKISPPPGVESDSSWAEGSINCNNEQYDTTNWFGDYYIPDSVYAETEDDVRGMISWLSTGNGIWTVTINGNVNGGTTPFSDDNELYAEVYWSIMTIDESSIEIINLDDF